MTAPDAEFHTHDRLTRELDDLVAAAPDLVSTDAIATTPEGREVWAATVAGRRDARTPDERPALLVTANLHARELAGSWVALRSLRHLVEGYAEGGAVRRLLDARTVYVLPRVAADAAEYVLDTRSGAVRSRVVDPDAFDYRPPNVVRPGDLTGDGCVRTMRWPAPDGEKAPLVDDPRMLVSPAADGTTDERYRVAVEGTVPDYDGGRVVDPGPLFRSDFNRNFPSAGWKPLPLYGQGDYPLSEPETRALAEFCLDRPNLVGVVDLHTGNPAVFYPSAVVDGDADLVERVGRRAAELTGFPYLASYAEAAGGERAVELPGSFKDFAYERLGVPAYVLELGMRYNYAGMETADLSLPDADHETRRKRALLDWHDDHLEAGLFRDWERVDHPQLGEVEVGGWDPVEHANPPRSALPDVASRVTAFLSEFADRAPDVRVASVEAARVGTDCYRVGATVVNRGTASSSVTERARDTGTRFEPWVSVETPTGSAEVVSGKPRRRIDHLDAHTGSETVEWVVRAPVGTSLDVSVVAPRGVRAVGSVRLGE